MKLRIWREYKVPGIRIWGTVGYSLNRLYDEGDDDGSGDDDEDDGNIISLYVRMD